MPKPNKLKAMVTIKKLGENTRSKLPIETITADGLKAYIRPYLSPIYPQNKLPNKIPNGIKDPIIPARSVLKSHSSVVP